MAIGLRYLIFLLLISSFPANSKWEDGIPMPQAKSGTVAAVIDNNIILIGGKSIVEGSPVSEIFDIKGNIWRPISIMPKKLIVRIANGLCNQLFFTVNTINVQYTINDIFFFLNFDI